MFFRKNLDSIQDVFLEYKILTVHELHIYELLEFVFRSCSKFHSEDFRNNLYELEAPRKSTRSSVVSKLTIPKANTKLLRHSINYRGARLTCYKITAYFRQTLQH